MLSLITSVVVEWFVKISSVSASRSSLAAAAAAAVGAVYTCRTDNDACSHLVQVRRIKTIVTHRCSYRSTLVQRRSEGVAGLTGRHLLGAANARKLSLKIHVKIQIVISYVFACNENEALQLQRVPILSILGYSIGSLAASGFTLSVLRQFCVGAGLSLNRILVPSFLR